MYIKFPPAPAKVETGIFVSFASGGGFSWKIGLDWVPDEVSKSALQLPT